MKLAIELILLSSLTTLFVLYLAFYNPPSMQPQRGDCIEFREARYKTFFGSNLECVKWKE